VAYRQLFAVVFAAAGLTTVACSGETSTGVDAPSTTDQAPRNPDAPPNNQDQTSSNPDRPPSNPDAPPGGGLASLCQALCQRLQNLQCEGDNLFGEVEAQGCDTECVIPAEAIPCENELVGFFECILQLPTLCEAEKNSEQEPSSSLLDSCRDAAEAFGECADTGEQRPEPEPTVKDCTPNGGCECADKCMECTCKNPTDLTMCTNDCLPKP
jgi:hypothetical protein